MDSHLRDRLAGLWRRSPLTRATMASWGAWGAIVLLGMVRTKINAVTLGSANVGIIGQANYLATWVGSIATVGLGTGCIRAIATARAQGDEAGLRAIAHLAVLFPTGLALLLVVPLLALSGRAALSLVGDTSVSWVFVLAALSVPLNLLVSGMSTVLQGEEHIGRSAKVATISAAINTALVASLVLGMHLTGAAIAILLTSLVSAGVAVAVAPEAAAKAIGRPFRFPGRAVLATVLKVSLASFVLGAAGTSADLVIRARVVGLLGVTSVGEYQPVFAISNQYLAGFIGVIGVYMFPTLTRMLESRNHADAERELDAGLRMMLHVFTPIIILLAVAAPLGVRALYSRQFDAAIPVLRIQLIGDILKVCAWSLGAVLLPLRLTRWWAGIGLCTVGVNVGLAWILLPVAHLPALGISYTVSWVLNLGATLVVLLRQSRTWLSLRSGLLAAASIVSVLGVVSLTLFASRAISLTAGCIVLGVWTWRAIHAGAGRLKAGAGT